MYYTSQYEDSDGFLTEPAPSVPTAPQDRYGPGMPGPAMMPGMPGQSGPPMTPGPYGPPMTPAPSVPPMTPRQPMPPGPPMTPRQPMPPGPPTTPRPPMPPGPRVSDVRLINDIREAVVREVHAYDYYTSLAPMATNEQDRRTILRIRQDEARHYRWFTEILRRLGAQQPAIPPGPQPRSFEEGVRFAIRDELDAAAFYQNIAYRARDRSIEMHFLHAAQDEQRHAAWLQLMLSAPRPTPYR